MVLIHLKYGITGNNIMWCLKKVVFLYITLSVMYTGRAQSSSRDTVFNTIEQAIRVGESKKLIPYFGPFVDIGINGKEKTYSSVQAELACHNFFRQYPCSDFSIIHTGQSKKNLQYTIGQYKSDTTNYNVLIKMRQVNGRYLVYEISFVAE